MAHALLRYLVKKQHLSHIFIESISMTYKTIAGFLTHRPSEMHLYKMEFREMMAAPITKAERDLLSRSYRMRNCKVVLNVEAGFRNPDLLSFLCPLVL
jgi:hypothetical protein